MRRYSTFRGRRLTTYEQAAERFAASRVGGWLFLNVFAAADRVLLPLTGGRLSSTPGAPVGLLETVGARSGRPRRTPVLYVAHGENLVIVASNAGARRHPAWLHNLRAQPEVRFLTPHDGWRRYRAAAVTGTERTRLWQVAADLFAGYAAYEARASGRTIAVVVLEPR